MEDLVPTQLRPSARPCLSRVLALGYHTSGRSPCQHMDFEVHIPTTTYVLFHLNSFISRHILLGGGGSHL